jgi:NADH-quinone oxidoreductase subunit C
MDIDILTEKFNIEKILDENTHLTKFIVSKDKLYDLLYFLKDDAEFDFDRLNSIIGVDLQDKIELIYDLYSTQTDSVLRVSTYTNNSEVISVVKIYKSAYFDECEIYDLFGVNFSGNHDLKRLLLPSGWIGHPLLKSYVQNDERLSWNK